MKRKMLLFSTIIFSLLGYLEWGGNHQMFLFQMEAEIFSKIFIDPISIVHPFIILPLIGQILLVISLVQTEPSKILVYSGIAGLAVLYFFILLVGILGFKYKIALLTLPFLVSSFFLIRSFYKHKNDLN
ncbi:MAG: hypothetical protein K9H61_02585 [Bacteroidia bacterium]|nr:hypothetical protein [Bacteroidia bacterium]MCF8425545.1 hypothetical protein [Bacteroidia bacterium]MCF8445858.1 hypothetical protein [Bacteroidia bacterium]